MQQPMAVTGRLVVQGSNASIPIPSGKPTMIIGREDPVSSIFPDIDLDPFGGHDAGVGRQHAKLLAQGGQILIEDNNSVNGTWVNRQKLPPNQPRPLNNGDELRLGKLILNYYTN
jgi:pSer/pThr/pTyr-binding forkhead associated (FHA) protein